MIVNALTSRKQTFQKNDSLVHRQGEWGKVLISTCWKSVATVMIYNLLYRTVSTKPAIARCIVFILDCLVVFGYVQCDKICLKSSKSYVNQEANCLGQICNYYVHDTFLNVCNWKLKIYLYLYLVYVNHNIVE